MNVNKVITRDYVQMDTWSIRKTKPIQSQLKPIKCKNKANTNPNKANFKDNIMLLICTKLKILENSIINSYYLEQPGSLNRRRLP